MTSLSMLACMAAAAKCRRSDFGVTVQISGFPTTGFDFGIAQTGAEAEGWYGKDSVYDEVIETGNFNLVVESESTLNDASIQDQLTYIVTADNGNCYVLGHEPGYYADLGCTRL